MALFRDGAAAARSFIDSGEEVKAGPAVRDFPTMAQEALIGLPGDIVRLIEPHTESDPNGLLLSAHTFFGNCVGRGPHYRVESTLHGPNLFVIKIGDSAKARKGTGEDRVFSFFRYIDQDWSRDRFHSGLSSGEGVIWAVRDQVSKMLKDGKSGNMVEEVQDPGVADKRLMVVESEFAGALRVCRERGIFFRGCCATDGIEGTSEH